MIASGEHVASEVVASEVWVPHDALGLFAVALDEPSPCGAVSETA